MYVGIVPTIFGNAVREASPRAARAEGRRAVGVFVDTRNQTARSEGRASHAGKVNHKGWRNLDGSQGRQVYAGLYLKSTLFGAEWMSKKAPSKARTVVSACKEN